MPSNWSLLAPPDDHAGGEGGGVLRERHRDREVRHRHEPLALGLALHDDPQRDRLHAPGGEAAPDVVPEQLRDLVADQPVDDAPGLLRAHPVLRDLPGLLDRARHRRLRDLVELGAVELGLRGLLLQQLVQVPADRLALAVGVGGEEDAVGLAGEPDELRDRLLLAGDDAVVRLVVLRAVDRDALLLEVADVAVAGGDLEVLAEELPEGGGLGRRFDDDEGACHGNRDTLPRLSSPPGPIEAGPGASQGAVAGPRHVPIQVADSKALAGRIPLRAGTTSAPCVRALAEPCCSPPPPRPPPRPADPDVFPMAVWYGGGKARAPDARGRSAGEERGVAPDLRQIKALGFNTVRCWIDWASGEPAPGAVPPRHPRRPPLPRRGGGAEGRRPGLHGLGARVGGAAVPGLALRQLERPGDPAGVLAGLLHGPPRRAPGRPRLLRGGGAARRREPRLPRLRPLERAPRHQLGEPDLHPEPRVLLLPEHRGALPRVAEEEVRHARRAERRLVPPLRVLGRGRAEPPQHDPLLHRLRRLEALHRRQARRGPARALRGGEARRPRPRRHEPRRRRRPLLLAALLGGAVRRLDDGRAGRLLRDVLLPEALGLRGPRRRVAGGAARLRALVRLRERGARLLDRRAAGRLRHDRAQRQPRP